jgi:hypothetical protein
LNDGRKKNKWLPKIKEYVDKNDPGALVIPFSGQKTVVFFTSKHLVIQFGSVMFGQNYFLVHFFTEVK